MRVVVVLYRYRIFFSYFIVFALPSSPLPPPPRRTPPLNTTHRRLPPRLTTALFILIELEPLPSLLAAPRVGTVIVVFFYINWALDLIGLSRTAPSTSALAIWSLYPSDWIYFSAPSEWLTPMRRLDKKASASFDSSLPPTKSGRDQQCSNGLAIRPLDKDYY